MTDQIRRAAVMSGILAATASLIGKMALTEHSPWIQSILYSLPLCRSTSTTTTTTTTKILFMDLLSSPWCCSVVLFMIFRISGFILMIVLNGYMMSTFLDGMDESGSVAATALSTASNFTFSALYGTVFFHEKLTPMWFLGFAFIQYGGWLLSTVRSKEAKRRNI